MRVECVDGKNYAKSDFRKNSNNRENANIFQSLKKSVFTASVNREYALMEPI
jgi:hypothetical protein